jgi:hypothetical protein
VPHRARYRCRQHRHEARPTTRQESPMSCICEASEPCTARGPVADCCCTPVPPSNGSRPKSPRRRGGRWSEGGPSKTDGYGEASITVGMASNPPTRLTRVAVATPDIGGLPRRRWCRRGSHDAPRTLPSLSKRQTPVGRSAPLRRRSRLATWSGAGGSRTASSGSAMHFARQGDREFF